MLTAVAPVCRRDLLSIFSRRRPTSVARLECSVGFDDGAVALLGGLGGGANTDALPGHTLGASGGHRLDDLTLATSPGKGGALQQVLLDGSLVVGAGLLVLEPLGELVSVVEDLLDGLRHQGLQKLRSGRYGVHDELNAKGACNQLRPTHLCSGIADAAASRAPCRSGSLPAGYNPGSGWMSGGRSAPPAQR